MDSYTDQSPSESQVMDWAVHNARADGVDLLQEAQEDAWAFARDSARRESVLDEIANDSQPGVTLSRDQLEVWAGRELTDDEVDRLEEDIPNSSIPKAIATIVGSFADDE